MKRSTWWWVARVAFLGTGVLVGLATGYAGGSWVADGLLSGRGVEWESLGRPEDEIDALLAIDAWSVYVRTVEDLNYRGWYEDCPHQPPRCWEEVEEISQNAIAAVGAACSSSFEPRDPPHRVLQCATGDPFTLDVWVDPAFFFEVNYALLEDGNVWYWRHSTGRLSDGGCRQRRANTSAARAVELSWD